MRGVGVDVVAIGRLESALARRAAIASRICTDDERAYCDRARAPRLRAERYAGRFAVKEAVMKVLGVGLGAFRLRDVEVVRAASGAPSLRLHGRAAEMAAERGISAWHLSITHDGALAIAVVLAE